jgi:hypothetical protein
VILPVWEWERKNSKKKESESRKKKLCLRLLNVRYICCVLYEKTERKAKIEKCWCWWKIVFSLLLHFRGSSSLLNLKWVEEKLIFSYWIVKLNFYWKIYVFCKCKLISKQKQKCHDLQLKSNALKNNVKCHKLLLSASV